MEKFLSVRNIFPQVSYWMRLPAFISWISISAGIWFSSVATTQKLNWQSTFYTLMLITSIILLFAGIIIRNKIFKFTLFFFLGFLVNIIYEMENTRIFSALKQIDHKKVVLTGKVYSPPAPYFNSYGFILKIDSCRSDPPNLLHSKMIMCINNLSVVHKSKIQVIGNFQAPRKSENSFGFDEYSYMKSQDLFGKMFIDSIISVSETTSLLDKIEICFRETVLNVLSQYKNPNHAALLRAAFLGETAYLDSNVKASFRTSGIYHLLSISGFNTAMLAGIIYFSLWIFPLGMRSKSILVISALWLYLLFIGNIPSLFRATVMTTCLTAAFLFQKKNHSLNSLGLAGTFWLMLSPQSLFSPGYQLSFAATFGIITLYPVLDRLIPHPVNTSLDFILTKLFSTFNFSFACFICTIPVLIFHFGTISIYGLLANLVAISLMSIGMWCFFFSIISVFLLPFATPVFVQITDNTFELLIALAKTAERFSWSSVSLPLPYPELFVLYIAITIGFITISKNYALNYLRWAGPISLLIIFSSIFFRKTEPTLEIHKFKVHENTVTAVQWPHKGIWLFIPGEDKKTMKFCSQSLPQWIRLVPYRHVEKVFICNKFNSGTNYTNSIILNNTFFSEDRKFLIASSFLFYNEPVCTCSIMKNSIKISFKRISMQFDPGKSDSFEVNTNKKSYFISSPGTLSILSNGNSIKYKRITD